MGSPVRDARSVLTPSASRLARSLSDSECGEAGRAPERRARRRLPHGVTGQHSGDEPAGRCRRRRVEPREVERGVRAPHAESLDEAAHLRRRGAGRRVGQEEAVRSPLAVAGACFDRGSASVPRARHDADVVELVETGECRLWVVLEVGDTEQVQPRASVGEEVPSRSQEATSARPEGALEITRVRDQHWAVETSGRVLADERGRRRVDRLQRSSRRAVRVGSHARSLPDAAVRAEPQSTSSSTSGRTRAARSPNMIVFDVPSLTAAVTRVVRSEPGVPVVCDQARLVGPGARRSCRGEDADGDGDDREGVLEVDSEHGALPFRGGCRTQVTPAQRQRLV